MTLDKICQMTTNVQMLNALHACREGHALNNATQWRNAYVLADQRWHEFTAGARAFLREKAETEQRAANMAA